MYRTVLLAAAGLFITTTHLRAQTIHGVVIEDGTRAPIADVIVELRTADGTRFATAQTNVNGAFLLSVRRSGSYTLHLVHLGYQPIDSEAFPVRSDETLRMELRLARTTIPLEPVVVTARTSGQLEEFHRRMRRGTAGRFVTREHIDRRPGAEASELLAELPGVEVAAEIPPGSPPGARRANIIYLRGVTGRCRPAIFVDGMLTIDQTNLSSVDDLLRPEYLEGAEVYTGTNVPPPFYSRTACGVVAFWTRQGEGGGWSWRKLGGGLSGFALAVLATRALAR